MNALATRSTRPAHNRCSSPATTIRSSWKPCSRSDGRSGGQPPRSSRCCTTASGRGPELESTPKSQPTIVGNYDAFATVQVVDKNGIVYGTSNVKKDGPTQSNGVANDTGKYAITFDQPLPDGLYTFFIRCETDSEGHMSHISPPLSKPPVFHTTARCRRDPFGRSRRPARSQVGVLGWADESSRICRLSRSESRQSLGGTEVAAGEKVAIRRTSD